MESNLDHYKILKGFGEKVKNRRIALGFSQQELADLSGLHRTYIGTLERGEKNISLVNIYKISNALNTPVKELI
ncbi:helix-turn-helix domain-containing protein [Pseudomonadota bacterium 24LQ007]